MKRKEDMLIGMIGTLTAALLLLGGWSLWYDGPLTIFRQMPETGRMIGEIVVFSGWNYWCLRRSDKRRQRIWGVILAVLLFTWCHQVFLPLLISFLYLVYLLLAGDWIRKRLDQRGREKEKQESFVLEHMMIDFLLGSAAFILIVCILSGLRIGGINHLRITVLITGILLIIWKLLESRNLWRENKGALQFPHGSSVCYAWVPVIILTMFAIQAGRMNISLDYDSLHYGLRTPYILNNGFGIYEDLGNINLVYTYSKGLECLVMPLSGTSTYSYVLSFNLWVTVGVLVAAYEIVKKLASKTYGYVAAAVISIIPGIMNMCITAKSDSITLLFQLFLILFTIKLIQSENIEDKTRYFILSGCACLLTYLFKPTSLVFSTILYGGGLVYLFFTRQIRLKLKTRWWLCAGLSAAAWLGIWARTLCMTGVPVTSVFTSIFDRLGFHVKPPFQFASIPNQGSELGVIEELGALLTRLWLMAVAPIGEDMGHVIIAWGTPAIVILLVILLVTWRKHAGKKVLFQKERQYLLLIFSLLSIVCLFSISMLWQVDGNYFMLFYALLVILTVLSISWCSMERLKRCLLCMGIPVILFNTGIACMTNWAGSYGFSPPKLIHGGFYNHKEEARLQKSIEGNDAIWSILAADPRNRVIAFGDHPEVLDFPCNVQSYYDVTGSGGNVVLVKKLDYFKEFLRYAKTDYIYVQAYYLVPGSRAWDIIRYMIEDGSMADVRYEHGNVIARVNLDEPSNTDPKQALEEFDRMYLPGPSSGQ